MSGPPPKASPVSVSTLSRAEAEVAHDLAMEMLAFAAEVQSDRFNDEVFARIIADAGLVVVGSSTIWPQMKDTVTRATS